MLAIALTTVLLAGQTPGDRPIKCGWGSHPELLQARIAATPGRPKRHMRYISPSGEFAVHYDTTARLENGELVDHSPPLASSRPDGIPDWVVEVAAALDSARSLLLDTLEFDPAIPDDDGIYDVYLKDYQGTTYGETHFETDVGGGRYITYMEMDNDFSEEERYYTHGIDAARVTSAHEYFHAVQLAYGWRVGNNFFYELSSTWFEDIAYPEVNDWVNWFYIENIITPPIPFGNQPTQAIQNTDGYSIAIFGHYLTQTYEMDIMRQAWERFKTISAVDALKERLSSYGSNLTSAWTDFVARLFFNGRAPAYYFYPDQNLLEVPSAGQSEALYNNQQVSFRNLLPGQVDLTALAAGKATSLYLKVRTAPPDYAARIVCYDSGHYLGAIGSWEWYTISLDRDSEVILVAGGESVFTPIPLYRQVTIRCWSNILLPKTCHRV
ncbi:MAG: MXAN_6640 family putative metalloprotease, partial [Candidatus Neomarinimicrobiota bacterium]